MIPEWLNQLNAIAWIASNVTILYISIAVILFVILYATLFNPRLTTGGRLIFRFALSLTFLIFLVVLGNFVNPSSGREWTTYPGDVHWWRPLIRLTIYGYIAYSLTSLIRFLIIRKWWPDKLRTAKDLDLIEPRRLD